MKRDNIHMLYQYISSANNWCSADELAIHLHTTTRSIRNYIREINHSVPGNNLILSSHKGYRWNKDFPGRLPRTISGILRSEIPTVPNDRYWYIIRKITVEQIGIDSLINNLIISERTIDTDIQKVREIAASYNLRLRKRKDTLTFSGKESDVRRMVFQCIMETTKEAFLSYQFVIDAFPEYDCREIHDILTEVLSAYGLRTNAYTQYDLLMRIVLQYRHINCGHEIASPECPVADLQDYPEFAAANTLADRLSAHSGHPYNLWEREYLTSLLIGKTDISPGENYPEDSTLKDVSVRLLKMAGDALQISLTGDDFVNGLVRHFQKLFVRQRMGLFSDYLIFDTLKTSYPIIQDVCAWLLLHLSRRYRIRIDRSEVGALAKLLCDYLLPKGYSADLSVDCTVVCPSIGNFPEELTNTLTQHLGNAIHIRSVINSLDVDNLRDTSELYLSVLPVRNIRHLVHISFYPRAMDFRHIYTEIHKIKMAAYNRQFYEYLAQALTEDTFEVSPSLSSREDICGHMFNRLKKWGYIDEGFPRRIAERENIDGSVFCDNIAIPHISSRSVRRSFAYLVLSRQPIAYEQSYVNIVCMIGTRENQIRAMQNAYDLAIKVFSFYPNVSALLNTSDLASFMNTLKTMRIVL